MAERPEDLSLPLAPITRIISESVPPHTNVSSEVKKVIARAASVFILYTASSSAAVASKAGRKTLNANDVLEAVLEMDFPQFEQPLKMTLEQYKKQQSEKYKRKKETKKSEEGSAKISVSKSTGKSSASKSSPSTSSSKSKKDSVDMMQCTLNASESDSNK